MPPGSKLAGFATWDADRQLTAITGIQQDPHLDDATRRLLLQLIQRRDFPDVLRNNAANALVIQEPPVHGLVDVLALMAVDSREGPRWRDYALQHLATTLSSEPSDLQVRLDLIARIAGTGTGSAGTALIQLDRLERQEQLPVDGKRTDAALTAVIMVPERDPSVTVTALGVAAMRQIKTLLPQIRGCLETPTPAVRRAAVAALGSLGDASDIARIESVNESDPAMAPAKYQALAKLRSQQLANGDIR